MSWAQLLHVHTDALAQVKHLETTSSFHAANEQYVLSDVQYLRQLKTLTVHAEYNADEPHRGDEPHHPDTACASVLPLWNSLQYMDWTLATQVMCCPVWSMCKGLL